MKNKLIPLSLAFVLTAATSALAGPISGTVASGVYAASVGGDSASDHQSANWSVLPTSLSANASATSHDAAGIPTTVFSNGSATWALDGQSGTFDLTWGWNAVNATAMDTRGVANNWSYTFQADATGWFAMSYDVVASGDPFGLWGLAASQNFDSVSGVLPPTNPFDPTASGVFLGGVTAGQVYTISLMNNGNMGGDSMTMDGSATGHYAWSIRSAPDACSTLLLLGSGLAVVLGLRRKLRG